MPMPFQGTFWQALALECEGSGQLERFFDRFLTPGVRLFRSILDNPCLLYTSTVGKNEHLFISSSFYELDDATQTEVHSRDMNLYACLLYTSAHRPVDVLQRHLLRRHNHHSGQIVFVADVGIFDILVAFRFLLLIGQIMQQIFGDGPQPTLAHHDGTLPIRTT